jgi:hypothetical protein
MEFNDIIKILCDISNGLYFILDHILLVSKLNVFKFDPVWISKVDWYSNLAWGGECGTNILYDMIDFYHNKKLLESYKNSLDKIENQGSTGKISLYI